MKWPNKVLMVKPNGYKVAYVINPHMSDENGQLKTVDQALAHKQWNKIKNTFENMDLEVSHIEGQVEFPDMVFCANQCFPFENGKGKGIILSQMHSEQRKDEVPYFKAWAEKIGLNVFTLSSKNTFEAMGDALWNYETREIFGGFGFRTDASVYNEVEQITDCPVTRLSLVDNRFYHLDTCLAIANKNTAFAVKEAFAEDSWKNLSEKFNNLIEIPVDEAIHSFAGNMTVVRGKEILIHPGATRTCALARQHGFNITELDTSEFMKSGGSIFCMKLFYF